MAEADTTQVDLVKLADGARVLRFVDRKSGVAVERKVETDRPVLEQKNQLAEVFAAAVARAQLTFA